MNLQFSHKVSESYERSAKDYRVKVNTVIASFLDESGNEYRKRFESKKEPFIPLNGSHEYINSFRYQWLK